MLMQKKLDEHAKKMEEKLEDLRKMIELSLHKQTEVNNLKQNKKYKNRGKSTDGKELVQNIIILKNLKS